MDTASCTSERFAPRVLIGNGDREPNLWSQLQQDSAKSPSTRKKLSNGAWKENTDFSWNRNNAVLQQSDDPRKETDKGPVLLQSNAIQLKWRFQEGIGCQDAIFIAGPGKVWIWGENALLRRKMRRHYLTDVGNDVKCSDTRWTVQAPFLKAAKWFSASNLFNILWLYIFFSIRERSRGDAQLASEGLNRLV